MKTSGGWYQHRKWYDGAAALEMPMKEFIHHLLVLAFLVLMATAAIRNVHAQEGAVPDPPEAKPGFRVVINAKNPTTELPIKTVSNMFYKRVPRWDDWDEGKTVVKPVDRETSAVVRNLFSKAIHSKSALLMEKYWQRMIFSGRNVPPPRENSDAGVLSFVRGDPGAIGYVTADAVLGEGVKELKIISN